MRSLFNLAIFLFLFSPGLVWSSPGIDSPSEITVKAENILKLQGRILTQLKEMKEELYVIKIRVTRNKRVQSHA